MINHGFAAAGKSLPDAVVATIGVFDGVHLGHRALFELVGERARSLGLSSLAITFDPHPVSVLAPSVAPHLLTPARVKLRLLAELGLDAAWVLPFSRQLAGLSPSAFVEDLLLRHVQVAELWIGYDFRFGKGREGDANFLHAQGEKHGFRVQQFGPIHERGRVLSSTWVREALMRGSIEEAEAVLGHPFVLEGTVGYGRGEGAKLLVPTANLDLPSEQVLPADGVYTAWAEIEGRLLPSVVSIGVRPTLVRDERPVVEAYVLGWEGNLRGRLLPLHFGTRMRPQYTFPDLASLKAAVLNDVEEAERWFEGRHPALRPAPASRAVRVGRPVNGQTTG